MFIGDSLKELNNFIKAKAEGQISNIIICYDGFVLSNEEAEELSSKLS